MIVKMILGDLCPQVPWLDPRVGDSACLVLNLEAFGVQNCCPLPHKLVPLYLVDRGRDVDISNKEP